MAHCLNCGGELKIIAAILGQSVIEKVLTHLGLQAEVVKVVVAAPRASLGRSCKRPEAPSQHVSGGPAAGAAGIGWARASQSRGLAPNRPGKPEKPGGGRRE